MRVLGISAFYHDAAAALVSNSGIEAAAQEERFTRRKHDGGFPELSIRYCLTAAGIRPEDAFSAIDSVAFYDKPFLKFERLLETYLSVAPRGFSSFLKSMPLWITDKLFQKDLLAEEMARIAPGDWEKKLLFAEHHQSHAASAFFPSPFPRAAVLTIDGVGEWTTTSLSHGTQQGLSLLSEIRFPHSVGLLYSAFTYFAGFRVNSGEYKLMGLAPYGTPRFANLIRDRLIDIRPDGSFRLDLSYFGYLDGLRMTNERFASLFGFGPRSPEAPLTQKHMDLAASVQAVTEEIVEKMARHARSVTGERNLCLAGGVALNCVANGKLREKKIFDSIYVQPAAGDAGGALGAAFIALHQHLGQPRTATLDLMRGGFIGPSYTTEDARQRLQAAGARLHVLDASTILNKAAVLLAAGKALGWFQGRMEFGPRSLGSRSILADPRSPAMQSQLNLKVKFRESFRPFAPAVLRERAADWFELIEDSPYMLFTAPVKATRREPARPEHANLFGIDRLNVPRSEIPAVTHLDYSARVQTVHAETNPRFHKLLAEFEALTGCPVLVNTSFNVRGEPIVESPEDAFRCFMGTGLDALVVENCLMLKEEQDPALMTSHHQQFPLD